MDAQLGTLNVLPVFQPELAEVDQIPRNILPVVNPEGAVRNSACGKATS